MSYVSKEKVNMKVSQPDYAKSDLKSNRKKSLELDGIVDSFESSYRNVSSFEKLGIAAPVSYIDIPAEMEDYKKDYDKYIRIVNEYIHNVEQNSKDKS